jgi:hypothetical protein
MTMNRDFIIKSTIGPVIRFEKDIAKGVPASLYQEALKYGAQVVNEEDKIEQVNKPGKETPQGQERYDKIKQAIQQLLVRNERGDFTGSGLPAIPVLDKLLGFTIDASERKQVWEVVQLENSDALSSNDDIPGVSTGVEGEAVG